VSKCQHPAELEHYCLCDETVIEASFISLRYIPDRLVEIRTVLEKMRPIDHRLKHQIDKLVKTAATGSAVGSDPSNFCAHPENMISKVEESEESETEDEDNNAGNKEDKLKKGVYVPPKLAAVHYGKLIAAVHYSQFTFHPNLLLLTMVSLRSAQTCCCSQ
jgi:hypothetical protein